MTQNPYAPPSAAPSPMGRRGPSTGGDIDLSEAISDAWQAMTENWALAIGGMLLSVLLMGLSAITCIGYVLLVPHLWWGMTALYLNILDDDAEIGDIFAGFNQYGSVLASMLGYVLVLIVILSPVIGLYIAAGVLENEALSSLAGLVNLLLSVFVTYRVNLAPYYIVDQGMGGVEACRAAWEATNDWKLTIVLVAIVSGVVSFLGVLLLVVGVLFTYPLSILIWTAVYRQLEPAPEASTGAFQQPPPPGYAPPPQPQY